MSVTVVPPVYSAQILSVNYGSTDWYYGETRTVTATIKNNGTAAWTSGPCGSPYWNCATPIINIGCRWNEDADYYVRVPANGLAPGATATYSFQMTMPTTSSTNNLRCDLVFEGCFWFRGNTTCNPSITSLNNLEYLSPTLNAKDPDYRAVFISTDFGTTEWCAGETRNVNVTVKNAGTKTWTDGPCATPGTCATPYINIGCKWDEWPDYHVRVPANNLAPGETRTYTLQMTAPTTAGTNHLSFDAVYELCFWFANNATCNSSIRSLCNAVYKSTDLTIITPSAGGSVTSDATICVGGNSGTLTLSGYTGAIQRWQSSVDAGANWSDISKTTTTHSVNSLTTTTQYRAVVKNGVCNEGYSNPAIITVVPDPVASTITKSPAIAQICIGKEVSASFSGASGGTGTITDTYEYSYDNGVSYLTYTPSVNLSLPAAGSILMRTRRTATGSGCTTSAYKTENWVVTPDPISPTLTKSPDVASVCLGGGVKANVDVAGLGGAGGTNVYERSTDGGTTWESHTITSTINTSVVGTFLIRAFRGVTTTNTGCTNSDTTLVSWTVVAKPSVTTQPGGATICLGASHTMSVEATGGTPSLTYQWQEDGVNIDGATGTSYTASPTTAGTTTSYRCVVAASGTGCSTTQSSVAKVIIYPSFSAGAIVETDETICAGGDPANIASATAASGGNGSISYQWQKSTDNGTSYFDIPGATVAAYNPPTGLTQTTIYRRTAKDGACNTTFTPTSTIKTVNVNTPSTSGLESNDYAWSGLTSNNWGLASNWLLYDGTSFATASVIPSNTSNVHVMQYGNSCVQTPRFPNVVLSNTANMHNLTIYNNVSLTLDGTINLYGNWVNNGTFTANDGSTVNILGSSAQTISGTSSNTYANLVINKSSGDVTVSQPININGVATFTKGILNGNVTFNSGSSVHNAASMTSASFVNGTVTKLGNSAFVFPIGSGSILAQFGATPNGSATMTARYNSGRAGMPDWWEHSGNMGSGATKLDHVSDREYWFVNSTNPLSSTTLYWNNGSAYHSFEEGFANLSSYMRVAYVIDGGRIWANVGQSAISGTVDAGTITSSEAIPFGTKGPGDKIITFGSMVKKSSLQLPIQLLDFYAECDNTNAILHWTTASEQNNDYFVIEKSNNAKDFYELSRVKGAGTSSSANVYSLIDSKLLTGSNYYRLKQVDYDGQSTLSDIIWVNCDKLGRPTVDVYPNPFNDELNISFTNITKTDCIVEVLDDLGRSVFVKQVILEDKNNFVLNLSDLKTGVYTLRIKTKQEVFTQRIVKSY